MKKNALLLASTVLFLACNNSPKDGESQQLDSASTTVTDSSNPTTDSSAATSFDITRLPLSTADIGDFPFINLPQGLEEMNKPLVRNYDVCFFPVDGKMIPFEGKLYKTFVSPKRGEDFSQHYFEKSMANYLESVGAVKIFDSEITRAEFDRYYKQDANKGGEGDMGYSGSQIKFWVIRSADQGNIYIQYTANNAGGTLNVLQEGGFEQTITKVTADKIAEELSQKGKAILYINFDTDKADLTPEGKEVVQEIAAALKKENSLNISIEGHTDNSGNAAHNKTLSEQRANAVLQALSKDGIQQNRLKSAGFGAEKPLLANDSEENKAKNRRVELVKTN